MDFHLLSVCRKLGIWFQQPTETETPIERKDRRRNTSKRVKRLQTKLGISHENIPDAPPITGNKQFDLAMDSIRSFELEQMSYNLQTCSICNECRIDIKLNKNSFCNRCAAEKDKIHMFSDKNLMNPGVLPDELKNLSIIEQQLISRISPCMNIHMLKHGGIASSGHCVTFPQDVNEPAKIFPCLPSEIDLIKVRKKGKNDSSKEFIVSRCRVETALKWLKLHNPAYVDIIISQERLLLLPENGELDAIPVAEYDNAKHTNDKGPAPEQTELDSIENCNTNSGVLFPDQSVNVREQVETIVKDVIGDCQVTENKRGVITIPWPTRDNIPMSEFTTRYFFHISFSLSFSLWNW